MEDVLAWADLIRRALDIDVLADALVERAPPFTASPDAGQAPSIGA
jgi:hypothetical protein